MVASAISNDIDVIILIVILRCRRQLRIRHGDGTAQQSDVFLRVELGVLDGQRRASRIFRTSCVAGHIVKDILLAVQCRDHEVWHDAAFFYGVRRLRERQSRAVDCGLTACEAHVVGRERRALHI